MGVESDRHTGERVHAHSFSNVNFMDRITEQKIKDAANVVDVIEDFLTLKPRGVEYVCLCPFHDDKTLGNFSVNPTKGVYKCFACGAGGDAIKFLMEYKGSKLSYGDALRYLAKKYSISIPDDDQRDDARWKNIKPAQPRQIVEVHKDMLVMGRDIVLQTMKATQPNIFIEWMRSLPWTEHQRKQLEQVLWLYCVGRWGDRVCFWQIDEQGRPRGGKLMRYGLNGKRDKDKVTGKPGWMHNQDGIRERCDMEHHEYRATLFGLHLLNRYPNASVNIVESEKTALFMSATYGDMDKNLWMACGGLEFLKLESLQPLIDSGRRVWIWPDKDGVEKWETKVKHLLNDRIQIYTRFFDRYWIEEDGQKADVCDVQLRLMLRPETLKADTPVKNDRKDKDLGLVEWNSDEPFINPLEAMDPKVREWREILRRKFNFNKRNSNDRRTDTN